VLLVDDQAVVRRAIADTFDCEPGFSVRQAGSLAEARAMLNAVDVAILDLGLPDGSGLELIQELHAVNSEAVAVVFSSSIDPAVSTQALARGAAAALNKLDGFQELLATVKRLRG
jgi:DNA-binding NarL/FixJ family response regulator